MNKRFLGLALLFAVVFGGIWIFNEWHASAQDNAAPPEAAATGVSIGNKFPEFTLPSLLEKAVTVKPNGKPVIINFFTTWCPPCRQEMPDLDAFAKKHQATLDFYAVNIQQSSGEVADFINENNYSFKDAVLFDENGKIARTFRVSAIPTTIIADKGGIIRHIKVGAVNLKQLEELLEKLP